MEMIRFLLPEILFCFSLLEIRRNKCKLDHSHNTILSCAFIFLSIVLAFVTVLFETPGGCPPFIQSVKMMASTVVSAEFVSMVTNETRDCMNHS